MKKIPVGIAVLALALAASTGAQASDESGPWAVRVGILELHSANKSDGGGPLGLPADAIHVSNKAFPEVDVLYAFTPNIVAELVLTYPQKHEVTLGGTDIGSFKQVPPSLLGQYHFLPGGLLDPYVGAGINFTWISSVHLLNGAGDLKKTSVGGVLDLGLDYRIDARWFANLDVKLITPLQSDVSVGGTKVSTVKVNPMLYGLGVGYRF